MDSTNDSPALNMRTARKLLSEQFPESRTFDAFLRWGFPLVHHQLRHGMDRSSITNLLLREHTPGEVVESIQRYREAAGTPEKPLPAAPSAGLAVAGSQNRAGESPIYALLETEFTSPSALDAFMLDYFPDAHRNISADMSRREAIRCLEKEHTLAEVQNALRTLRG